MQNAALRVAVERDLLDCLLENGKPHTKPITAGQLMSRLGGFTFPEAMISKSSVVDLIRRSLRKLTSLISPYYEGLGCYGLMRRRQ